MVGAELSWGAIFAGVVTFLAIVFLFSLLAAAFGLDGSGTGAAVFSIVGVLLGFFAAGGVAGALAVRGGLIHGFLTWAGAVLATVLFVVVSTLGTAGAVGGVLGSVVGGLGAAAGPSISKVQPSDIPVGEQSQCHPGRRPNQLNSPTRSAPGWWRAPLPTRCGPHPKESHERDRQTRHQRTRR